MRAIVVGAVAAATALAADPPSDRVHPASPVPSCSMDGVPSEVYKQVGDVRLQIYKLLPGLPASTPGAAVVFFFGGGWVGGSVAQFRP